MQESDIRPGARRVYRQARTSLFIMGTLFVVFFIGEQLGYGDKPQYIFNIGLSPMVSSTFLGIALVYAALPFRDLEFVATAVLAVCLEFILFGQRPYTWDMSTKLGAMGVGLGVACWLAMLFRIASSRGWQREQSLGYWYAASILPMFPKVGGWMHYFVIRGTSVIYDQYGYAIDGLLGFQPAILMARLFVEHPRLHEISMFFYNKLPLWMVLSIICWLKKPARVYFNAQLVMVILAPLCFFIYAAFPMIGISLIFPDYPPINPPIIMHPVVMPLQNLAPVSCMPSMHAAWIFTVFLVLAPQGTVFAIGAGLLVFFTLLATLGPEAGHYLIDLCLSPAFLLLIIAIFAQDTQNNRKIRRHSILCGGFLFFFSLFLIRFHIGFLLLHGWLTVGFFSCGLAYSVYLHWRLAIITLDGMAVGPSLSVSGESS